MSYKLRTTPAYRVILSNKSIAASLLKSVDLMKNALINLTPVDEPNDALINDFLISITAINAPAWLPRNHELRVTTPPLVITEKTEQQIQDSLQSPQPLSTTTNQHGYQSVHTTASTGDDSAPVPSLRKTLEYLSHHLRTDADHSLDQTMKVVYETLTSDSGSSDLFQSWYEANLMQVQNTATYFQAWYQNQTCHLFRGRSDVAFSTPSTAKVNYTGKQYFGEAGSGPMNDSSL